jgi:hypothetical protein
VNGWADMIHPDDRELVLRLLDEARENCSPYHAEYRMRRKSGGWVYIDENGIFLRNAEGVVHRMLGSMSDITERKRITSEMAWQATHDALTGLVNRHEFEERVARLLFNVPMAGGWPGLILGTTLFIIGSLGLGFLISTLTRTQLQAMQLSVFYLLPSILLSGFMFPFRGMPDWAQWLGSILPVTHFLRVVRGALLKGQSFADMAPSLLALAVFVCAVTALALARYRTTLD